LFGALADQRRAGNHRQPRLFLGPDDLDRQAGFAPDHAHEIAAVARAPAGLGRDQPHAF
jgi:hypothetical protein